MNRKIETFKRCLVMQKTPVKVMHCKIVFVEVESNVNDHDKGITYFSELTGKQKLIEKKNKLTFSLTSSVFLSSTSTVFISSLSVIAQVTWNAVLQALTEHWIQAPLRSLHEQHINAHLLACQEKNRKSKI